MISYYGSVALLSHNNLKWSEILGLSFFVQCWLPRESMLTGFKHTYWISHFTFNSANTLALCQSKAMLPWLDCPINTCIFFWKLLCNTITHIHLILLVRNIWMLLHRSPLSTPIHTLHITWYFKSFYRHIQLKLK